MQQCTEREILCVTTTVATLAAAQTLARELLARRLAACVQIEHGLICLYRWNGELCEEAEVRVVIKTLPGCEPALQALFAQHHPYELPQFVAVRMGASPAYFEWVGAQVSAQP